VISHDTSRRFDAEDLRVISILKQFSAAAYQVAEISVQDSGQGIAPEFVSHVFDRFSQADSSRTRSHSGLGLGLAIVKHLVELHGGNIYAKSPSEGKGSTISVQLPIAIIHQDPNLGEACGEVDLSNVRVLIVDDDSDTCEMLRHVLQKYGAIVDSAPYVMGALDRLNEKGHDIIISDIGMPDMDGYEFIRRVCAGGGKIPAIAVTAFADSEDRERLFKQVTTCTLPSLWSRRNSLKL
jgi:CheY-like chemotaxis protein